MTDNYTLPSAVPGSFYVKLKLPDGLTCSQCVLQVSCQCGCLLRVKSGVNYLVFATTICLDKKTLVPFKKIFFTLILTSQMKRDFVELSIFLFLIQTIIILYFSGLIILPILGEVVGMELKELAAEHKKHLGPVQILRYQQMDRKILRGMASSLMT